MPEIPLQMPGCEENVRDIVTAARTRANIDGFRITHEDLIRCAADVIRTVARCTVPDKEK